MCDRVKSVDTYNKSHTVNRLYSSVEEKHVSMPAIPAQALGTQAGVTPLQPWVPVMNCHETAGAGAGVPANEPHLGTECTVPWWDHSLQIQAGPPPAIPSQGHPPTGGRRGLEEL